MSEREILRKKIRGHRLAAAFERQELGRRPPNAEEAIALSLELIDLGGLTESPNAARVRELDDARARRRWLRLKRS